MLTFLEIIQFLSTLAGFPALIPEIVKKLKPNIIKDIIDIPNIDNVTFKKLFNLILFSSVFFVPVLNIPIDKSII